MQFIAFLNSVTCKLAMITKQRFPGSCVSRRITIVRITVVARTVRVAIIAIVSTKSSLIVISFSTKIVVIGILAHHT